MGASRAVKSGVLGFKFAKMANNCVLPVASTQLQDVRGNNLCTAM